MAYSATQLAMEALEGFFTGPMVERQLQFPFSSKKIAWSVDISRAGASVRLEGRRETKTKIKYAATVSSEGLKYVKADGNSRACPNGCRTIKADDGDGGTQGLWSAMEGPHKMLVGGREVHSFREVLEHVLARPSEEDKATWPVVTLGVDVFRGTSSPGTCLQLMVLNGWQLRVPKALLKELTQFCVAKSSSRVRFTVPAARSV